MSMIPSPMQYLATNLVAFVAGMVFVAGINAYGKRMKASGERAARAEAQTEGQAG